MSVVQEEARYSVSITCLDPDDPAPTKEEILDALIEGGFTKDNHLIMVNPLISIEDIGR